MPDPPLPGPVPQTPLHGLVQESTELTLSKNTGDDEPDAGADSDLYIHTCTACQMNYCLLLRSSAADSLSTNYRALRSLFSSSHTTYRVHEVCVTASGASRDNIVTSN